MATQASWPIQKFMKMLLPAIGNIRFCSILAAWLAVTCLAMHAQDSKLASKPSQKTAAHQSGATVKDTETTVVDGADPAFCIIKSDDIGVTTKTDDPARSKVSDEQDQTTKVAQKAAGEDLSLRPLREEWGKDGIHLSVETNLKQESRSDKSESNAASDLKCTPQEEVSNAEPSIAK
jgi:hypothetical protein